MAEIKNLTIGQDELDLSKYSYNTKINNSTSNIVYKKITITTTSGQASDGVVIFGRNQFYLLNLMYASGYMGALHEIGTKANSLTPTNNTRYIHLKVNGTSSQPETIIYAAIENYSFISMFSTAKVTVEDSTKSAFDSASTNVTYRYIPNEGEIKYKYTAANLSPAENKPSSWKTLFSSTNGVYFTFYDTANKFDGQPTRYGFLRTLLNGSEVNQTWFTQSSSIIYTRGGNSTGWYGNAENPGNFNKLTPNDAVLTIQKNGTDIDTFSANASSDKTINITVPVTAADVSALPDSTKYGSSFELSVNSSTFVVTASLKDQDGNVLGTTQTIDLPLESVVVNGSFDSVNKKIILTLQNGNTVDIPVGDLVAGLQTEITNDNKLSSDLVDDTNHTNKFVTAAEKTKLAGIETGAEVNVQSDWNQTTTTADDFIKNKPNLATVATSGSYNDLSNKPTIPTVNNATLTIQKNGTTVKTFTANASSNVTANITVPTKTSDITNDSNFAVDANYVHTDNNYTTTEKNKLAGIASGAEVNVQSDWNQTSTTADDFIKNKPDIQALIANKVNFNSFYNNSTTDVVYKKVTISGFNAPESAGSNAYKGVGALIYTRNQFYALTGAAGSGNNESFYEIGSAYNDEAPNNNKFSAHIKVAYNGSTMPPSNTLYIALDRYGHCDIHSSGTITIEDSTAEEWEAFTTQVQCQAIVSKLTKNSSGTLGQITAGKDSQSYLETTKITTAMNIDDLKTTGLYIIGVTGCTGTPTTAWGTLYVDWTTGTKYQIYICDGATPQVWKRGWNSTNSAWSSWTRIAYPVDTALSSTSENPVQNKVITNKLDEYVSKATTKECGVGNEITLENTSDATLILNSLKGDSHQRDFTGKNLFRTKDSTISNSISFYSNENGTYDIQGTATAEANHIIYTEDISDFEDGATYTLSATKPLEYGCKALFEGYNGTTWVRHVLGSYLSYTKQTLTATANLSGCTRVRFVIRVDNKSSINTKGLGIQLEKNSSATDFEPYNGGVASGTPSPTNPVKIDTVTGVQTISVDGRNLFDKNNYTPGYWWNNNGVISGGSTELKGLVFECKPNTEYCIIKSNSGTNNRLSAFTTHDYPALGVSVLNQAGIAGAENNDNSVNIITPDNAKYLVLYLGAASTTPSLAEMVNDIVIKEVQNYQLDLIKSDSLIDVKKYNGAIEGVTCSLAEDGTFTLSGTATAGGVIKIPLRFPQSAVGKRFTFTSEGTFTGITNYGIKNFNATSIVSDLIFTDATSYSFIATKTIVNNAGWFVIYCNTNEVVDASFKFQLVQNNVPKSYELFEPLELRKIGTSQDILYKDGAWKKDKYVEYAKFDGTETTWELNTVSGQAAGIRYLIPIDNGDTASNRTTVLCNRAVADTGSTHAVGKCFIYQSKFYFYPDQSLDTVEKFTEWLTSNNIEIIYPAKTKVTEQITNPLLIDELDRLEEIHGNSGNTVITTSATNLPIISDVCQNVNDFSPASENQLGSVIVGDGLKIDNGGTLSTDDTRINQIERYYRSLVPVGTRIVANDNLNTVDFLTVGKYYCSSDSTVATLTNCPTTRAFMMEVFSVLSNTIDDEFTTTWCYRVRMITDYYGNIYIQRCSTGGTPGIWTYQAWQKIYSKSDFDSGINSAVLNKYGKVQCSSTWPADKPWVKIAQVSHGTASNDNIISMFALDYTTSDTGAYLQRFEFGIGMRCSNTALSTNKFELLRKKRFGVSATGSILDFFSNVKVTYRWTAGSSGVAHKIEYQIWVSPKGSWRCFWLRPQEDSYKNDYGINGASSNSANEWTYYTKSGAPSSIGSETYLESGFTELACSDLTGIGEYYLDNAYPVRATTANITPNGRGGLMTFKATSAMTTAKPVSDGHIIHFNWDNTGGYDSQLYVGQGANPTMAIRAQNAGTWGNWIQYAKLTDVEILDTINSTDWNGLWQ